MTRKPKKKDTPAQRDKFIETARALECDENEAAFDEKLKRLSSVRQPKKGVSKE